MLLKTKEAKQAIENAVVDTYRKVLDDLKLDLPVPTVIFKTNFASNGRITYNRYSKKVYKLEFNLTSAVAELERFCKETVTHEISHHVTLVLYGNTHHDSRFKRIHRLLGGKGERGNAYDKSNVPVPKGYHLYRCDCRLHHLSTIRHNRQRKGLQQYVCALCSGDLKIA